MDNKLHLTRRDFTLDSLRGIASVIVVLFHYTMFTGRPDYGFRMGLTGVDLFFIVSGFVIFMTSNKVKSSLDFVTSRFIRLYPTYWFCVTFTFVVYSLSHTLSVNYIGQYLINMTMFQHYMHVEDLDGPYWTMNVEMVFYLTMLVIYRTGQLKHIERIGMTITLATVVVTTVGFKYFPETYRILKFLYPLLNYFALFFAGILFYLIKYDRKTMGRYMMVAGCFIASLLTFDSIKRSMFITYAENAGVVTLYFSLFILYVNNKLGWIENKVFVYLGSISYALYLIHQYVSLWWLRPFLSRTVGNYFWLNNAIMLIIVIGLASAVTYWIEKPAMRVLKARLTTRKPITAPAEKQTA